jgi:hypothetical protein
VRGGEEEGGADAVVGVDFRGEIGSHLRALRWFREWLQWMEVAVEEWKAAAPRKTSIGDAQG